MLYVMQLNKQHIPIYLVGNCYENICCIIDKHRLYMALSTKVQDKRWENIIQLSQCAYNLGVEPSLTRQFNERITPKCQPQTYCFQALFSVKLGVSQTLIILQAGSLLLALDHPSCLNYQRDKTDYSPNYRCYIMINKPCMLHCSRCRGSFLFSYS